MEDLISRKAAIDAIMDADVCVTWNGVISDDDAVDIAIKSTKGSVISSIVNMPSAQPETHEERTETHACDCISRQAAIEEISKQQTYKMFEGEDTLYLDANDVGSVLASLPSAQPDSKETSSTHKALDWATDIGEEIEEIDCLRKGDINATLYRCGCADRRFKT